MAKGEFGEPRHADLGVPEAKCMAARGHIENAFRQTVLGTHGPGKHRILNRAVACVNALDGYRPEKLEALLIVVRDIAAHSPMCGDVATALGAFEGKENK